MTFEQIIKGQNSLGYTFHVFQEYGPANLTTRGFSKSFVQQDAAIAYANKVPGGIVYNHLGQDIYFVGQNEKHERLRNHRNFEERLTEFVPALDAFVAKHYGDSYPGNFIPKHTLERGKKYIRVVSVGPAQRSAYCFLDFQGNIYKCEGWKNPAKHIRGSIFDENFSLGKGLGIHGAAYLR
jgi:hypothetical protein